MQKIRGIGLALALSLGIGLGALPLSSYEAAAQTTLTIRGEECGINLLAVCSNTESETGEGGDATSRGGNGGNGGNVGLPRCTTSPMLLPPPPAASPSVTSPPGMLW